jgi:hypothetical protein
MSVPKKPKIWRLAWRSRHSTETAGAPAYSHASMARPIGAPPPTAAA